MRAQTVNFERGLEPKKAMGIGRYFIPSAQKLIGYKNWADLDTIKFYQQRIDYVMKSENSDGYRKYIEFVVQEGHISSSSSSVFNDWTEKNADKITLQEVKDALDDLWPSDKGIDINSSKRRCIVMAQRNGVK